MQYFDLNRNTASLISEYSHYGKVSGLLLAHLHHLPVPTIFWICSFKDCSYNLPKSNIKYLCRPDAPKGKGNNLPRGRDLAELEILSFFKKMTQICSEAIILIFQHPSISLTGSYIPRYQVDGGATVIINKEEDVTIEFVGKGFDVGDITRGKTVHTSLSIPIAYVFERYRHLYRYNLKGLIGNRFDISFELYRISRMKRITELQSDLGEKHSCENDIPLRENTLSYHHFKTLFVQCVEPIILSTDPVFDHIFGIMLNIYKGHPYIFEIWNSSRNIEN